MKNKAVDDFLIYLTSCELGISYDPSNIIDMINFLEVYQDIQKVEHIYERLINL